MSNTDELVRQMSVGASYVVTKEIPFANDDVPRYLEKLRRFEEASRDVVIEVCTEGTDVQNTPSLERLRQLAAANPPPQSWLDGDEEDLFTADASGSCFQSIQITPSVCEVCSGRAGVCACTLSVRMVVT